METSSRSLNPEDSPIVKAERGRLQALREGAKPEDIDSSGQRKKKESFLIGVWKRILRGLGIWGAERKQVQQGTQAPENNVHTLLEAEPDKAEVVQEGSGDPDKPMQIEIVKPAPKVVVPTQSTEAKPLNEFVPPQPVSPATPPTTENPPPIGDIEAYLGRKAA